MPRIVAQAFVLAGLLVVTVDLFQVVHHSRLGSKTVDDTVADEEFMFADLYGLPAALSVRTSAVAVSMMIWRASERAVQWTFGTNAVASALLLALTLAFLTWWH